MWQKNQFHISIALGACDAYAYMNVKFNSARRITKWARKCIAWYKNYQLWTVNWINRNWANGQPRKRSINEKGEERCIKQNTHKTSKLKCIICNYFKFIQYKQCMCSNFKLVLRQNLNDFFSSFLSSFSMKTLIADVETNFLPNNAAKQIICYFVPKNE